MHLSIFVSFFSTLFLNLSLYYGIYLILNHSVLSAWSVFQISFMRINVLYCCLTVLLKILILLCHSDQEPTVAPGYLFIG